MIFRFLAILIAANVARSFDWQHGDTAASRRAADQEELAGVLGGLAVVMLWLLERCL